jgi:hypothetical protein
MTRALLGLLLSLCCSTAWGQYPIYPAYPQPAARWAYSQYPSYYQSQFYPSYGYGYRPYGYGGYGNGPYGYGGFGFGVRGYYPPNPFGNMNWLPPNPPSPYYVTPSGKQYLDQAQREDQATYSDLMLRHYLQQSSQ